MRWLKQSTTVTIKLGPFVDDTDGKTIEAGLTIQKADVRLSKNGGNYAAAHADQGVADVGAPYDEVGEYDIALDDTNDTDTLGHLRMMVIETGALPVWAEFRIVPANVWDSLFGADKLVVDVEESGNNMITAAAIATDAIDADALKADAATEIRDAVWGVLPTGTVLTDAGNNASTFKTSRTETETDHWKGAFLTFTTGDLAGQTRQVGAYNGTTKVVTLVVALSATPADDVAFILINR